MHHLSAMGEGARVEGAEVKTLIKLTRQTSWWDNFMRKRNVANVDAAIRRIKGAFSYSYARYWTHAPTNAFS